MSNKWKNKNLFVALKNAFNGIIYVLKTQRNLKIQIVIAILVIFFSAFFKITLTEFSIIILTTFLVFFAELTNTVVETIVDMITVEYNEKAKIAKDISAGGVTIVSIASVIIGIIIFLPKIMLF